MAVVPFTCPHCGGQLQVEAFVTTRYFVMPETGRLLWQERVYPPLNGVEEVDFDCTACHRLVKGTVSFLSGRAISLEAKEKE